MAFYDDRKFLLSHIHHSFITCDDTGMCEMAMLNDMITDRCSSLGRPELECQLDYHAESSELLEATQSYDIVSGMGFIGGHRHRSNTAQRLEKMKKDRQMQAQITHIQWKDPPAQLSEKELCELFPEKDLSQLKDKKEPMKSALSEALELYPAAPNNPFGEYARFDGRVNQSAPSKKISIFLTMQAEAERNYPMEVICLSNARVSELIGLICWMYTNEGRKPELKNLVSSYCLKIAEETGEVDEDFPSLDTVEFVGKFGFPFLALIEQETKTSPPQVTINIEGETFKFDVPKTDITLREIAEVASRRLSIRKSSAYRIERIGEPGIPVPLDKKVNNFENLNFQLIFEENPRERLHRESEADEYDAHMKAVEAPLYRTFNVTFCQKMGMNYDVQLGISGEKVEINPLPQKGAAKILSRQQKPATLYMDTIAACEIISKKYNPGRCTFKLVHQNLSVGPEFKKYVFETDPPTAQDIVKKIQLILEMSSTNACKEYQLYREKKLQRKIQKSQQTFKT